MPRKKASAPQRLDEDERQNQNWNMGEGGSGNQEEVIDLINLLYFNFLIVATLSVVYFPV